MTARRSLLKRLTTPPLVVLAVLVMLVEEHLWRALARLGAWVGRWPPLAAAEARLAAAPVAVCLAALLAPATLLLPVNAVVVWLMAAGHFGVGLVVLLAAKLAATAMVARIYAICLPKLETVGWFVRVRDAVVAAKDWSHRKLEATAAWRWARRVLRTVRDKLARGGALAAHWRVIRRRMSERRA